MKILNSIVEQYGTGTVFGLDPGTAGILRGDINEFNGNNNEQKEYDLEQVGPTNDHQYTLHLHEHVERAEHQPEPFITGQVGQEGQTGQAASNRPSDSTLGPGSGWTTGLTDTDKSS